MVRGSTPALTLTIPGGGDLDLTQAVSVYVTIRMKYKTARPETDGNVLTISGDRLTVEARAVTFYLTQEESLTLSPGEATAQINWLYYDDSNTLRRGCDESRQNLHQRATVRRGVKQ